MSPDRPPTIRPRPVANAEEVHLWRIALDPPDHCVEAYLRLLAPDERARADRFLAAEVGRRFAVGRGALRTILGRYLDEEPGSLAFRYGPQGKPSLAGASPDLRFNLAHSRGLALLAITLGREVGVDIEGVREMPDADALVDRFFSAREAAEYRDLPTTEKPAAFFRGWARKEAFVKATGLGLSLALDLFDVSFTREEHGPPLLREIRGEAQKGRSWCLRDVDAIEGFAAAIAAEGQDWATVPYHFDHS